MKTENLSTLKIHKLSKEQYDRELAAGRIDETAIYLTPDDAEQSTDNNLNYVDGFILQGPALTKDSYTLTSDEVEDTNKIRVHQQLTTGELHERWVLINGKRAYVGGNTPDSLILYTDETMTTPMNISCPLGTVIYPADVCIDVATPEDLKELDTRILTCTGIKIDTGVVYPYMSPNLAGEVFSLRTDGEIQDTYYVKFKGAASPLSTNSLAGRWVLIDGKRAYVGSNTVNTLVLYPDETKSAPCNITCAADTIIYPADIAVASSTAVSESISLLRSEMSHKANESHSQAASTITAGTFAGQVVASSAGQTPTTSCVRNSRLVATDTNPTVNGEIVWIYG